MIKFKRDWSDLMNPVLLKELRQGVRSKQFTGTFVLVQVVMVLFVTFALAANYGSGNDDSSQSFWFLIAIYLLGILPLTGLGALSVENNEGRLDLLQLSQLHSRGIVFGKWLSLNIQGLLVISSLLPYLALRYFVGSVNPLIEIAILASLVSLSLIGTAVAVCFSVVKNRWLRYGMAGGAVWLGLDLLSEVFFWNFRYGSTFFNLWWDAWLEGLASLAILAAFGFLIIFLLLEFAASRISHEAQNHETSKRLIIFAGFMLCFAAYPVDEGLAAMLTGFLMLMALAVCASAIMHEPPRLPGPYLRLMRLGWLGRYLLYPGWPSALNVIVLCASGFSLIFVGVFGNETGSEQAILFFSLLFSLCGCLLLPRAVYQLVPFQRTSNMRVFWLIQTFAVCICLLVMLLDDTRGWNLKYLFGILPQGGVVFTFRYADASEWDNLGPWLVFASGFYALASLILCYFGARRWRKVERDLENHARQIREQRLMKPA